MCAKCGVGWLLPAALFLVLCCLSSVDAQVTLTEEEFTTISENLMRLEEINETQALELDEQAITLKQLSAQVLILQTASASLTNQLNVTAMQLQRADASLTRAAQYWNEQEGVRRRRTLLTGVISGFAAAFAGLVAGVVWG